jgi:hypothetical protein
VGATAPFFGHLAVGRRCRSVEAVEGTLRLVAAGASYAEAGAEFGGIGREAVGRAARARAIAQGRGPSGAGRVGSSLGRCQGGASRSPPAGLEPATVCLEEGPLLTRPPWSAPLSDVTSDDHPTYIPHALAVTALDERPTRSVE